MSQLKEQDGKYYQQCKVVMLATEKPNPNLFIHKGIGCDEKVLASGQGIVHHKEMIKCGVSKPQHLYIISDAPLKVGDWIIYSSQSIRKVAEIKGDRVILEGLQHLTLLMSACKKIIATTDIYIRYTQERTVRGAYEKLSFEDGWYKANFKPTYVAGVSSSFIKKYIEEYNKGNIIENILVELETQYQVEHFYDGDRFWTAEPIKWIEEN
jgi:hypothetical protein